MPVAAMEMAKMALNLSVMVMLIAAAESATVYTNHTVGGPDGWFFNATTNTSATNYTAWAVSETFNLGDFLVFNTNSNQSVVQTYNESLFQSCNTDDATDDDYFLYNGGVTNFSQALTISFPLTIQGPQYYFSDAGDDGVQCSKGMAFAISVNRGLGLPPSLNQPPPPPYIEPPPDPDSAQSPPVTVNGSSDSPGNDALAFGTNVRVVLCALLFAVGALISC
ncbi:Early nodulin-like protein 18 isoform 1 [Tripterygium wilfordii]|uniref:Early nodulin-like protein 18 isoform 1 n=1 Tax=Tripterygium wilfordii TaxID=458696 RepID=A0A7J7CG35_TRIWF|nr:blue copper protein-like [Tripterygium wilfordii]KAF5732977.1 Early nodulin-like protein 18 isoform 1 [Tripterygium wilfordii]